MGKILQAFADGELYVTEIVQKRTPEHQKLIEKNLQLYNQLLQKLNENISKFIKCYF